MRTRDAIFMAPLMASLTLAMAPQQSMASVKDGSRVVATTNTDSRADSLKGLMGEYFVVKWVPVGGKNYVADTVSILHEQYFGDLDQLNDPAAEQRYIESDPDYYKLFVPFTYYNSPMEEYSVVTLDDAEDAEAAQTRSLLPIDEQAFTTKSRTGSQVNKALLSAYVNEPNLVKFTESQINEGGNFIDRMDEEQDTQAKNTLEMLSIDVIPQEVVQEAAAEIKKPNWWTVGANGSFQMSQSYFSNNWYKASESNISMIATFQATANYNDNEKVQWENMLDAKLGVASSPSDTYHDYLVNTDQLRLNSKLGIQAHKHWYYTIAGEAKTQFMRSYSSNSDVVKAAFLAPLDVNVSVGMDYKLEKKNYKFSVMIAPLAWTMRYIGSHDVDETTYGVDKGKRVRHNIGSELLPTLTWNITKNISFESRLDYMTSYTWTRVDWENTFNFAVNKYLSTKLYVHTRFDDSEDKSVGHRGIQLNELFSFGLNFKL